MIYRNPLVKRIALRLVLLVTSVFIGGALVGSGSPVFLVLIFIVLIGVQFHALVLEFTKNETAIKHFLDGLKKQRNQTEWIASQKNSALKKTFLEVEKAIKSRQIAQEAEYQYFRNIVQHVGIGIITFSKSGDIQLYNFAAKKLLNTSYSIKNIAALNKLSPELVDTFKTLKTGGRKLVEVKVGEELRQLSIYVIELQLHDEQFKLVSLQNIQSELDEKEMEAWRNLIRVLTHEIMNSVTPISSLSNTTYSLLADIKKNGNELVEVPYEDIEDLKNSIKTIENRSAGLIRFLNEFRSLTHTPNPKLAPHDFNVVIAGILQLMKKELHNKGITVHTTLKEGLPMVKIDRELIEQVVINLIKNAAESFEEEQEIKNVWIHSNVDVKNRVTLQIRDDGNGIEPEAMTKIFIPFFTTKKTGSGIGLSLSKEIIRKHQGNISVQSELGVGTEFTLKF
ncbi:MAG: two-component system nitrogen regulation sensor histidine kinase NtrY [Marivirga sp.]|jgi:two-component system nitrogen regulation sensor histidine kinase NtrY